MNKSNNTYTYRCGEKVELEKSPDQIVVRALPENLQDSTIVSSEQISSASTRINVSPAELEGLMNRSRNMAPTHHAYYESETAR